MIIDVRLKSDTGSLKSYGVYDDAEAAALPTIIGLIGGTYRETSTVAIIDDSGENSTQDFRRYLAKQQLYDNLPCSSALADLTQELANSQLPGNPECVSTLLVVEDSKLKRIEQSGAVVVADPAHVASLIECWRAQTEGANQIGKHQLQVFYRSRPENEMYIFERTIIDGCSSISTAPPCS